MTCLDARARRLLSALLLCAPLGASAGNSGAADPRPQIEPSQTGFPSLAEQIVEACDAEAVAVRLLDPSSPSVEHGPAPDPILSREKDAQNAANRLGAGVESEADGEGHTLLWKRGDSKIECRAKLLRLRRDFHDRVGFTPATEERVAELRRRRDAMIPEKIRRNGGDATLHGGLFDGSAPGGQALASKTDDAAVPAIATARSARPSGYAPAAELPASFRGALASAPPQAAPLSPMALTQRVSGAWSDARAYVSEGLEEAGRWVGGVARSVRNRFFEGIELIQGFGYKLVHEGRQTNWGTKPLVDGLRRIAAFMRGTGAAETDLAVGDISRAGGGRLGGHASHRTGRDVDIGFYMIDADSGKAVDAIRFVRFRDGRDGLGGTLGGRPVRFDAERNWLLVRAILANPDPAFAPTNIFIAEHLKRAILEAGAKSPDRERAAALMSYWPGHENHLHLRIR